MKHLGNQPIEEILRSLGTRPEGLNPTEVQSRLHAFGKNVFELHQGASWPLKLLAQFNHFFALVLLGATGLCFYIHHLDSSQGLQHLGSAILVVVIINGVFSFWQEYRAEKVMESLRQLLPLKAKVRRQNPESAIKSKYILVEISEVVPGDILLLHEGDIVPADSRLIASRDLRMNNATLTGESKPQSRSALLEINPGDESVLDNRHLVFAGTSVLSGEGEAVVYATGTSTEFGKMAQLTQTTPKQLSPLQLEIKRVSQQMMWISVILAALCFAGGVLVGLSPLTNFIFALGIMIANIPEGLLPTVTLALAAKTQKMARQKALVRHLPSVETLGCTSVICTDKTGTLTENKLTVEQIYLQGQTYDASHWPRPWSELEIGFFQVARFCHSLKLNDKGLWTGDPLEIAMVRMTDEALDEALDDAKLSDHRALAQINIIDSLAFDSDRRRMSVLIEGNHSEKKIYCKGAAEVVAQLCSQILWDNKIQSFTPELREQVERQMIHLSDQGFRVLALAQKASSLQTLKEQDEFELQWLGLVALQDPPREKVPEAIQRCHEAQIRMIMITGDHPVTALAIARQIGMIKGTNPQAILGYDLQKLSASQLQLLVTSPEILFARVTAQQKMLIVEALRKSGEIVAVTGDGVNDAPALKAAHIGIAMGVSGTSVAKEAADIVLLDDNFATIVNTIEEGRSVYENIKKFLTYILSSNIPEIIPYWCSVLFAIPLPLTILQILAVDLGTDLLPALGLGAEYATPDLMKKPPRRPTERLLSLSLLLRSYFFIGLLESVPVIVLFLFYLQNHNWHYGESLANDNPVYQSATTLSWTIIVIGQMLNVFLCKHETESTFNMNPWRNKIILIGLLFEVIILMVVVLTPVGNFVFGTNPFEPIYLLYLMPFLLLMLFAEELRKYWMRRKSSSEKL